MELHYPSGATPIDLNEIEGLIPEHINLQTDLNAWEQLNIVEAEGWAFTKKHPDILTISFIQQVHKKMFNKTWQWAGKFRQSDKNIGVSWETIPGQLKLLLDDTLYQISNKSYGLDELALRFHHRLVAIHCFPNGNGRHARLMKAVFCTY